MQVTVFGANGPTGRLVVQQALTRGHEVRAVTRHHADFPLHDESLDVVQADVFDASAVDRAVAGSQTVVSVLGVPYSRRSIRVYSQGTENIISAMQRQGVRRFLCTSSSSTFPVRDPQSGLFYNWVILPLVSRVLGRTTYEDMRRMETLVRASDLDWTIFRPSGLFMGAQVTSYQVGEEYLSGHFTARADLADSLLHHLEHGEHLRRAVAVITTAGTPSPLDMLRKEVLKQA